MNVFVKRIYKITKSKMDESSPDFISFSSQRIPTDGNEKPIKWKCFDLEIEETPEPVPKWDYRSIMSNFNRERINRRLSSSIISYEDYKHPTSAYPVSSWYNPPTSPVVSPLISPTHRDLERDTFDEDWDKVINHQPQHSGEDDWDDCKETDFWNDPDQASSHYWEDPQTKYYKDDIPLSWEDSLVMEQKKKQYVLSYLGQVIVTINDCLPRHKEITARRFLRKYNMINMKQVNFEECDLIELDKKPSPPPTPPLNSIEMWDIDKDKEEIPDNTVVSSTQHCTPDCKYIFLPPCEISNTGPRVECEEHSLDARNFMTYINVTGDKLIYVDVHETDGGDLEIKKSSSIELDDVTLELKKPDEKVQTYYHLMVKKQYNDGYWRISSNHTLDLLMKHVKEHFAGNNKWVIVKSNEFVEEKHFNDLRLFSPIDLSDQDRSLLEKPKYTFISPFSFSVVGDKKQIITTIEQGNKEVKTIVLNLPEQVSYHRLRMMIRNELMKEYYLQNLLVIDDEISLINIKLDTKGYVQRRIYPSIRYTYQLKKDTFSITYKQWDRCLCCYRVHVVQDGIEWYCSYCKSTVPSFISGSEKCPDCNT